MTPRRAKMIRDRPWQRLAPRPQAASSAAVVGLAKFSGGVPDQRSSDQIRSSLHHFLVERHRAWSSCHQVACGRTFFYVTTLGWEPRDLHLPPRTGRPPLPPRMSVAALQRLCTSAPTPKARALLMTTYAAGRRVGEVVRLQRTDLDRDRLLIRVHQGKGRKDRDTRLSARLLAALRASGHRCRPASWLFPGKDATQPMPIATAPTLSDRAKRAAGITHGTGIPTLRHCLATHRLEAGVALRTIPRLLGQRSIDPTTRSLHLTRQPLAKVPRPFDLLGFGETPGPQQE